MWSALGCFCWDLYVYKWNLIELACWRSICGNCTYWFHALKWQRLPVTVEPKWRLCTVFQSEYLKIWFRHKVIWVWFPIPKNIYTLTHQPLFPINHCALHLFASISLNHFPLCGYLSVGIIILMTLFQVMFIFSSRLQHQNMETSAPTRRHGDLLSCDKWKCYWTAHERDRDKSLLNDCDGCHVQEARV